MAFLLKNVYALDGSGKPARRCDLKITDGTIEQIAPAGSLKPQAGDQTDDRKDRFAVVPAFTNAHGHTAMTLLRGLGEDEPLMEWLEKKIFPREAHLTPSDVEAGTSLALAEMALAGTAFFADMYYHMSTVSKVTKAFGLRAALDVGVVSRNDDLLEKSLNRNWSSMEGPLIQLTLAPHAPYTVSMNGMKRIAAVARERGLIVQTHFLEAGWERGYLKDTFGMTPMEYLEQTGLLDVKRLVLAHGVWFTEDEISALAERRTVTVVHCPASNLKLGSGIAKLPAMLASELPVALGTDGAASNNRLDLWGEMRMAALLHKGTSGDPTTVPASAALDCATRAGAAAFGFDRVGRIEEGWSADLMFVDLGRPNYMGADEESLAGFLVYAGSWDDVTDLMVNGRWVVLGRRFLPSDLDELTYRASMARRRLLKASSRP